VVDAVCHVEGQAAAKLEVPVTQVALLVEPVGSSGMGTPLHVMRGAPPAGGCRPPRYHGVPDGTPASSIAFR
jgi:hypothetical protein